VSKYSTVAPPYAFDITKAPMAKQHLKIEKSPTVLVFKEGKEVERIEEPNAEKMKDLDSLFG
jgi:thioredoxin-like negative regulator of GroEL